MPASKYEINCYGLQPSVNEQCQLLILGSMPGVESLRQQEYYAYPRNRFWPLIFKILTGSDEVPSEYQSKLEMLLKHRIALWDAIGACERQGSLDTAIHNAQGNDFEAFLEKYPQIKTICCNGAASFKTFSKFNKPLLSRTDLKIYALPSTSPANARWTFEMLLKKWQEALANI